MTEITAADRFQEVLFGAKYEELTAAEHDHMQRPDGNLKPTPGCTPDALYLLEESLTEAGKESLESLAQSAVLTGCCPLSSLSPSASINQGLLNEVMGLSRHTFDLQDHISSIETLTQSLQDETNQTLEEISSFRAKTARRSSRASQDDPRPSTPPQPESNGPRTNYSHLYAQIQQHQRETQQLQVKSAEYDSRIDALRRHVAATDFASSGGWNTNDLVLQQQLLHEKKVRIKALEARFKEFHGLPPDIEASRKEIRRAQEELDGLKRRRDGLFEKI